VQNTTLEENIPNGDKIFQMAVKETKMDVPLQDPPKFTKIGIFWIENKTIWQPWLSPALLDIAAISMARSRVSPFPHSWIDKIDKFLSNHSWKQSVDKILSNHCGQNSLF
jgi:hypothetical protein